MSLEKYAHVIKEIDEVKVRIIEAKVSKERVEFLQRLMEHNGSPVKIEEVPPKTEEDSITYSIGCTDIIFNPIVKVYNRELRTFEGNRVTPDYWNQKSTKTEPNYWDKSKKD